MNLQYDGPLSNFAFNCNLRHCILAEEGGPVRAEVLRTLGILGALVGRCRFNSASPRVSTGDPTLAFSA